MATNYPYYSPYAAGQAPNPYQAPRPQYMEQPAIGIKGRPVSSIEEARAASIDFDGSIFFFPDIANKRIYTKQINLDGTSTLNVYEQTVIPVEPVVNLSQYITREEFETALVELKGSLQPEKKERVVVTAPAQAPAQAAQPQFEF